VYFRPCRFRQAMIEHAARGTQTSGRLTTNLIALRAA
jgi:hypothetical protein